LGAEISRYELNQARYSELHPGDAVTVFVTEPIDPQMQVKDDVIDSQSVQVLKLNYTRKFQTGIYPYSTMSSIFSPLEQSTLMPMKVSTTIQEWCGHVFMQINNRESKMDVAAYSYFQSESDTLFSMSKKYLEDGLLTTIRLAPWDLPLGQIEVVPSAEYLRLVHKEITGYKATATLRRARGKQAFAEDLLVYTLTYPQLQRTYAVYFTQTFPYRIEGWDDTYPVVGSKELLTSTARRTHTIYSYYWEKNSGKDRKELKKLGLEHWIKP